MSIAEQRDRAGESHLFRGNGPRSYPDGSIGGTPGIPGRSLREAIDFFRHRRGLAYDEPDQPVTDVGRLASLVQQAELGLLDTIDLCEAASAEDADLFCSDDAPPQSRLPFLRGQPRTGSRADKLPKNEAGQADLSLLFQHHLAAKGHEIQRVQVSASRLRPVKLRLDAYDLANVKDAITTGAYPPADLFAAANNYLLDGHHRWALAVGLGGKDIDLSVRRVDLPVLEALLNMQEFGTHYGLEEPQ